MSAHEVQIHPTAIVHAGAEIGAGTVIGPYSIVGPHVKLGKECRLASHVVVEGYTTLGDRNILFQFSSIGSIPQDLKYRGEKSTVEIGDDNTMREYVTIQPGTTGGGMRTVVGNKNLFMVSSHIGHDTIVGSGNVFANCAAIAGHVTIGNTVIIGGLSAVHQFVKVGDNSFVAGMSGLVNDLPPYCMAQGTRAELVGLNLVGVERAGFSSTDVGVIKKIYKIIIRSGGLLKDRLAKAEQEFGTNKFAREFIDFIRTSERGISSPRKRKARDGGDEGE